MQNVIFTNENNVKSNQFIILGFVSFSNPLIICLFYSGLPHWPQATVLLSQVRPAGSAPYRC